MRLTSTALFNAQAFVEFILEQRVVRVIGVDPLLVFVEEIEQQVILGDRIVEIRCACGLRVGQRFGCEFVQFFDIILGEVTIQLMIIDHPK